MDPRLKLLPAGSITGTTDGLLQSPRLPRVVDGLRELADYVIFDVAAVADDLPHLTRLADVTLIVLRAGGTKRRDAMRAVAMLRDASAGLTGTVLNRAPVVIAAPAAAAITSPVEEAAELQDAPVKRLEIAVDELLADLQGSLLLIRGLRRADEAEEETLEAKEAELATVDR
jgi:MinD-like ATPase involved in chromosome partitioning or flagellar assembly